MAVQILMCGGRRTGKTSVLAAIQHNIQENFADGSIVFKMQSNDNTMRLVNFRDDMAEHINDDATWDEPYYYPAETLGTNEKSDYPATIEFKAKQLPLDIKFVDVPGEWYENTATHHNVAVNLLKQSEVLIVAVDTPCLIECDVNGKVGAYHEVMNRSNEITELVKEAWNGAKTPKMLLFTLVKCEKYMRNKTMNKVLDQLEIGYHDLIAFCRTLNSGCTVGAVSCKTIGGMEFAKFEFPDQDAAPFFVDANGIMRLNFRIAYSYLVDANGDHYYAPELCEQPLLYCARYILMRCGDLNFLQNFLAVLKGHTIKDKDRQEAIDIVNKKLIRNDEDRGYRCIHNPHGLFPKG